MDNRNTAAVYKFKARFPRLNESTGREFKKKKREQGSVGIDPKVFIPELVDHCYKMIWTVWFRHASSNLAIVELL